MTGPEEDPTVDLAAILRSERVLSELSERRGPDDAEEPLSLLAALAADVDDDAGAGALDGVPAEVPYEPARPVRGRRRWVAAAVGLAATVVGTTGVAAASPHGFPPVSALFGQPSPSSSAAVGADRTETETPATAAPTTLPTYPNPTPSGTPTKRATPSGSGPGVVLPPAYKSTPSASPRATSADPSPTPSGGTSGASSRTASPSADPTPSDDRSRTAKPLIRLSREIDRLTRPSDRP